jgi:hypothetical protein
MIGVLIGPVTLAAFHYWGFCNVLGGRGRSELTTSPARALLFFLGLHLDQGQGLFVQNPLFLAGIPALVIWARRRPALACLWTMLYLSLIGAIRCKWVATAGSDRLAVTDGQPHGCG